MIDMVWIYCTLGFCTQIGFIYFRTLNVRNIAAGKTRATLLSGTGVHAMWLISIAVGSDAVVQLMRHGDLHYLPVPLFTLSGGLLGTWMAMRRK